jgi:hypothetical protein
MYLLSVTLKTEKMIVKIEWLSVGRMSSETQDKGKPSPWVDLTAGVK